MQHSEKQICFICHHKLKKILSFENNNVLFACPHCKLKSLLPLPSQEEINKFYNKKEYYSQGLKELHNDLTVNYDDSSPIIRLYKMHLDNLTKFKPPPAQLLEIGCARGVFLDLAQKARYKIQGIEINQYATEYAKKYFNLDILNDSFEAAELKPVYYDIILAFDIIEHVIDPQKFIKKAYSALKENGILILGTPNSNSLIYKFSENIAKIINYKYPLSRFLGKAKEHLNIFNPQNLGLFLEKNDFKLLKIYSYNIPLKNICQINFWQKIILAILMLKPYEFTIIAQKK